VAKITIVGIGPGSPDYITPVTRKTVQNAQVVIGAERALLLFLNEIEGETLTLTAKNMNEALKYAAESSEKGKTVALLSTGDPGFSGLLGTFLSNITGKGVEVDVIPGVSSIQVCAARLRMCWDETSLFSFHEGTSLEKKKMLAAAVKEGEDVMLLPDPKSFPPCEVAKFLIENGIDEETPVVVCENLTLKNERVIASTLAGISKLNFGSLCVMAVRSRHKQKIKRKAKE
jgi:cobalt-precorrin-7 (C5)-methyltransferase